LLLSAFPNLDTLMQEQALIYSAVDLGAMGPDDVFGYGRLDLSSAFNWIATIPTPTPDPTINLALNQPVWASSAKDSSHAGEMAVDGDAATDWQTQKASGKSKLPEEWITIDLGTEKSINRINLLWGTYFAVAYSIQGSNDQNIWDTIYQTNAGDGAVDEIIFSTAAASYIRMNSTAWSNGTWRNKLQEFQIFSGIVPSPTPTMTPTPTSTPTPGPTGGIHIGGSDLISEFG